MNGAVEIFLGCAFDVFKPAKVRMGSDLVLMDEDDEGGMEQAKLLISCLVVAFSCNFP